MTQGSTQLGVGEEEREGSVGGPGTTVEGEHVNEAIPEHSAYVLQVVQWVGDRYVLRSNVPPPPL